MPGRSGKSGTTKYQGSFLPALAVLLIAAVLAVFFYCSGGLTVFQGSQANQRQIEDTREILRTMENRSPVDLTGYQPPRFTEVDLKTLEEEVLSHYGEYEYNSEYFRGWYENAVIVGDSIAEATRGFEWIYDSSLQAQIGIGLYSSQEVIDNTIWLQPSVIFLTFSANDIASYTEYVEAFIRDYTQIITRLQENLPWAEIYVQGILPCSPEYSDEYWYYIYRDSYNEQMEQMCSELGVHYYDVSFICETHPEVFDEDGLHPMWPFYPLWLTYMAEIAGLS